MSTMDKEIWRARLRKCYLTCEVSGPGWVIMSPEVIPGHHPESPHTWQRRYCVAIMEQRGRGQLANGGGGGGPPGNHYREPVFPFQTPALWGPQSGEHRTTQQLVAAILRMACSRVGVGRPAQREGHGGEEPLRQGAKAALLRL